MDRSHGADKDEAAGSIPASPNSGPAADERAAVHYDTGGDLHAKRSGDLETASITRATMQDVSKLRARPLLHVLLAGVGLVVVLAAVVPHWSELGHVLSGQERAEGNGACLSGYEASADGTTCHTATWVQVAEIAGVFVLLNGAVLGWVAYKSQRERSRRASALRQDWLVARAQARLNAKAAAAHAVTANWVPAATVVPPPVLGPAEMVRPETPVS